MVQPVPPTGFRACPARRANGIVPDASRLDQGPTEDGGSEGAVRLLEAREIIPLLLIVYGITILLALLA